MLGIAGCAGHVYAQFETGGVYSFGEGSATAARRSRERSRGGSRAKFRNILVVPRVSRRALSDTYPMLENSRDAGSDRGFELPREEDERPGRIEERENSPGERSGSAPVWLSKFFGGGGGGGNAASCLKSS